MAFVTPVVEHWLRFDRGIFRIENRPILQFSAFVKNDKFQNVLCGKKPVIPQWTHHLHTNHRQNGNFSDLHIQFWTQAILNKSSIWLRVNKFNYNSEL